MNDRFHPNADGFEDEQPDQLSQSREPLSPETNRDSAQDENPTTTRRLVWADTLVRMGNAHLDGTSLVMPLISSDEIELSLNLPLPPDSLEPVMTVRVADEVVDAESREGFFRAVKDSFDEVLPGSVVLRIQLESADIRWSPRPLSIQIEAQERITFLAEHVASALRRLQAGDEPDLVIRGLADQLSEHQYRADILSRRFPEYALLRLPAVGLVHLLAYRTIADHDEDPLLLAYQTNAGLWSLATGRGFVLAFRFLGLPDPARRDELASRLASAIERRFGIRLEPSDDYDLLGDWNDLDRTCLLCASGRTGLSFSDFILALIPLLRFSHSLLGLVLQNRDPFSLLGTHPVAVRSDRTEERLRVDKSSGEEGQIRKSEDHSDRPRWKAVLDRLEEQVAGDLQPAESSPDTPRVDRQPPSPQTRSDKPAIDALSPREIIQKLGVEEAVDMDVFLSHAGYNISKTVDIMAIALSIPKEEAMSICERAPCLIVGPVTRSKASQLKTILEGTGARIRVVPTGTQTA